MEVSQPKMTNAVSVKTEQLLAQAAAQEKFQRLTYHHSQSIK